MGDLTFAKQDKGVTMEIITQPTRRSGIWSV